MKTLDIPEFDTKKELFDFLVKNKQSLIAQKKAILKESDTIGCFISCLNKDGEAKKANEPFTPDADEFKVRVIVNTTNILDSHQDVHIKGLWNKTLNENKTLMHLQEHKMAFDKIISDGKDLSAFVKNYSWGELGFNYDGETQALVFDSLIKRERNPEMFREYSKGYVRQHSVGMQYVKIVMAINDENYGAEFEAWEKYYDGIVNKEDADNSGYFWAVKDARLIEGSAVVLASNPVTPTIDNNMKSKPDDSTCKKIEPPEEGTQINYKELTENFKLKI